MQKRKQWAVDINIRTHLGLPINCLLLWQWAYIKYPTYCILAWMPGLHVLLTLMSISQHHICMSLPFISTHGKSNRCLISTGMAVPNYWTNDCVYQSQLSWLSHIYSICQEPGGLHALHAPVWLSSLSHIIKVWWLLWPTQHVQSNINASNIGDS